MEADFFATTPPPISESPNPDALSSGLHSAWQFQPLPEALASSSSLSFALDEASTRPPSNRMSPYNRPTRPLPPRKSGSQPFQEPRSHEVIEFRRDSRLGIPLDSLLAGTTRIDNCYKLLDSPSGFGGLMHISLLGYPSSLYCLAVKGRILRFTHQTLGRSIADNIQHYVSTYRIRVSFNKLVLVALKRRIKARHWVAVVEKIK